MKDREDRRRQRQAQRKQRKKTFLEVAVAAKDAADFNIDCIESRRDPRVMSKLQLSNQDVVAQRHNAKSILVTSCVRLEIAEQILRKTLGMRLFWKYVREARKQISGFNERATNGN